MKTIHLSKLWKKNVWYTYEMCTKHIFIRMTFFLCENHILQCQIDSERYCFHLPTHATDTDRFQKNHILQVLIFSNNICATQFLNIICGYINGPCFMSEHNNCV